MAEIKFTDHAILKIEMLKRHGVDVSKEIVEDIVKFPDTIEKVIRIVWLPKKRVERNTFSGLFMKKKVKIF